MKGVVVPGQPVALHVHRADIVVEGETEQFRERRRRSGRCISDMYRLGSRESGVGGGWEAALKPKPSLSSIRQRAVTGR